MSATVITEVQVASDGLSDLCERVKREGGRIVMLKVKGVSHYVATVRTPVQRELLSTNVENRLAGTNLASSKTKEGDLA